MNLISQMLRSFIILTVLLLTFSSLSANWLFERGSLTDCLNNCMFLLEAQRKADQLGHEMEVSVNRVFVKAKVAEALAKGEMKLIDAAAVFRYLHEERNSWHALDRPLPDSQDAEAWCREAMEWAERYMRLDRSPSESPAFRQRSEPELQELPKRLNTVKSPE
jgi:hypothetical protein